MRFPLPAAALVFFVLSLAGAARLAAEPKITRLTPPALTPGAATVLVVEGQGLSAECRLLLPVECQQLVQQGATAQKITLEVTLPAETPVDIVPLRVFDATGVSNLLPVSIDPIPTLPWAEPIAELPAARTVTVSGNQKVTTRFAGKEGEELVVDVQAKRLGGSLRPTLRLLDARGTQLAWSPPLERLGGDARCSLRLPYTGEYTLELHDELFRAAAPTVCRVRLGALRFADASLPLALQRGQKAEFEPILGNLPAESRASMEPVAEEVARWLPLQAPKGIAWLEPPVVSLSEHSEIAEPGEGAERPLLAGPAAGVSGRIAKPGEVDRYRLTVSPGQKLLMRLAAASRGSRLDGVLTVRAAGGGQLARGDDFESSTDPRVEVNVPNNVNELEILVSDLADRGGEEFFYHLEIEPAGQPGYALVLESDTINIPAGGTVLVPVALRRAGYNGPVNLSLRGLPTEVRVAGNVIPAGADQALLTLTAPAESRFAGRVVLFGEGNADAPSPVLASTPPSAFTRHRPHWAGELAVGIRPPAQLALAWNESTTAVMPIGGGLSLPLTLARAEGTEGTVRISLRTTQPQPTKKEKKDNKDVDVPDLERTLRLAAPLETAAAGPLALDLLVPADLPARGWQMVAVAELLSADGKQVKATAVSPALTLNAEHAIVLSLEGEAMVEARAGNGATGSLRGKLERRLGFAGPVSLALRNLPAGYESPRLELAAGQADFTWEIRFPKEAKPGDLQNVQLVAEEAGEPTTGRRASNPVPIKLKVVAGE